MRDTALYPRQDRTVRRQKHVGRPARICHIRKLEYYREGHSEKHLHDITGMLEISGDIIKQDIIREWVDRLDLQKQWAEASQKS